jgi:hypothetical protein
LWVEKNIISKRKSSVPEERIVLIDNLNLTQNVPTERKAFKNTLNYKPNVPNGTKKIVLQMQDDFFTALHKDYHPSSHLFLNQEFS